MPRALRVEYEGATYHVMCRGNRNNPVFSCEEDVALWLKTLGEACERSQMIVHAYCLMHTHYHLLLETPKGNLVEGMKWLQATFTQRYNAMHRQWGHLFQGRYKAKVVDDDPSYFRTAGLYILLNPVDSGLIDLRKESLDRYSWSAYPSYLSPPSKRPVWLKTDRLMKSVGIGKDSAAGRTAFGAYVKERGLSLQLNRLTPDDESEWKSMERGWVHGSADFKKAMIELLKTQDPIHKAPSGIQHRDVGEQEALLTLQRGMRVLGLRADQLQTLKKCDERKLLLAGWIRRYFPVRSAWCSEHLVMGHVSAITKAWKFYENPPETRKKDKQKLEAIVEI